MSRAPSRGPFAGRPGTGPVLTEGMVITIEPVVCETMSRDWRIGRPTPTSRAWSPKVSPLTRAIVSRAEAAVRFRLKTFNDGWNHSDPARRAMLDDVKVNLGRAFRYAERLLQLVPMDC